MEKEHCEQVPHHLLDVADIGQIFNAADFCKLAEQAIQVGHQVAINFYWHRSEFPLQFSGNC